MLRVAITGTPGSNHWEIGKEFAARLDLPHLNAKQLASKWCSTNSVNYYMFKQHYEESADIFVDTELSREFDFLANKHIVIDSLQAIKHTDCMRVLVTNSIIDSPELAKSLYEEKLLEIRVRNYPDLFQECLYDVSFPSIYLPQKTIVEILVSMYRDGVFSGHYLHPYQVYPLMPAEYKPAPPRPLIHEPIFDVIKFGQCFYIEDPSTYEDYLWYVLHARRMKVNIKQKKLQYNQLAPVESYGWLKEIYPQSVFCRMELCIRLARYAARYDVVDHDQLYLDLSRNSNPLRVLREGGF